VKTSRILSAFLESFCLIVEIHNEAASFCALKRCCSGSKMWLHLVHSVKDMFRNRIKKKIIGCNNVGGFWKRDTMDDAVTVIPLHDSVCYALYLRGSENTRRDTRTQPGIQCTGAYRRTGNTLPRACGPGIGITPSFRPGDDDP